MQDKPAPIKQHGLLSTSGDYVQQTPTARQVDQWYQLHQLDRMLIRHGGIMARRELCRAMHMQAEEIRRLAHDLIMEGTWRTTEDTSQPGMMVVKYESVHPLT